MSSLFSKPLRFAPLLKRTLWGGRNLGTLLGKPITDENDFAESWELVDRSDAQSRLVSGPPTGLSLRELLTQFPAEILGKKQNHPRFPLLIKYLDCHQVLSVQVHPEDTYAQQMSPPDLGKTEAWYVIAAEPGSVIYAGLKPGVGAQELREAVQAGQTAEVLHSIHPQPGDCYFIPAGTVHALGAGLVVAEVQQSSDTTFRLFDWNRVDAAGKTRQLHLEQALEVIDFARGPVSRQVPTVDSPHGRVLVDCDYFTLRELDTQATASRLATLSHHEEPLILMVTRGRVQLSGEGFETQSLNQGETVLLPACLSKVDVALVSDDAHLLEIRLP